MHVTNRDHLLKASIEVPSRILHHISLRNEQGPSLCTPLLVIWLYNRHESRAHFSLVGSTASRDWLVNWAHVLCVPNKLSSVLTTRADKSYYNNNMKKFYVSIVNRINNLFLLEVHK